MSRRRWTEEEINRLRAHYSSDVSIDSLSEALPGRTTQAIRQKASRLGLRREVPQPRYLHSPILVCRGEGDYEGLLIRCSNCGSWMRVDLRKGSSDEKIRCEGCGCTLHSAE
ncbi:MAG: hypothetical protein QW638_04600 [Candidatus Bathyarchaeia archaeon]